MRIRSIHIENYKRFYNGLGKYSLVLDMPTNKVIRIIGRNGRGKSTLLNVLSVLPDPNNEIIPGKNGMKELVIEDGTDTYIIRYMYNAITIKGVDTHQLKGYISKNNEELNPAGNVTTCKELLYNMFGLDSNFESLTQLSNYSTKTQSLANMKPADRKKFIASILSNLDTYNNIYKTLSKRSSIFRSVVNSLTGKMGRLGDPDQISIELQMIETQLKRLKDDRDSLMQKLGACSGTQIIDESRNLQDQIRKYNADLCTYASAVMNTSDSINNLVSCMNQFSNEVKAKLNWFKNYKPINVLADCPDESELRDEYSKICEMASSSETELYKRKLDLNATSESLSSLDRELNELKAKIKYNDIREKDNANAKIEVDRYYQDIITLSNKNNDIAKMGTLTEINFNQMLDICQDAKQLYISSQDSKYLRADGSFDFDKLKSDKHKYYRAILNKGMNYGTELAEDDFKSNLNYEFRMIEPEVKDLDILDNEIITNGEISSARKMLISYNKILCNEIAKLTMTDAMNAKRFDMNSLTTKFKYDDLIDRINELINIRTDYCLYINYKEKYDTIMSSIKKDPSEDPIQSIITRYNEANTEYMDLKEKFYNIKQQIHDLEENLKIAGYFKDITFKFIEKVVEIRKHISNRDQIGENCDKANARLDEISELSKNAINIREQIDTLNTTIKDMENKEFTYKHSLNLLKDYSLELELYSAKYDKVEILKKHASPTKGIQTVFISLYMSKILKMANQLLSLLFDGEFVLQNFIIGENEFRIPVNGNGLPVDDISSMSASQVAMINMCVSFALLHHSSTKFKVIRLDEIDGALDMENRSKYPMIVSKVVELLQSEQCFLISHNIEFESTDVGIINLDEIASV